MEGFFENYGSWSLVHLFVFILLVLILLPAIKSQMPVLRAKLNLPNKSDKLPETTVNDDALHFTLEEHVKRCERMNEKLQSDMIKVQFELQELQSKVTNLCTTLSRIEIFIKNFNRKI